MLWPADLGGHGGLMMWKPAAFALVFYAEPHVGLSRSISLIKRVYEKDGERCRERSTLILRVNFNSSDFTRSFFKRPTAGSHLPNGLDELVNKSH